MRLSYYVQRWAVVFAVTTNVLGVSRRRGSSSSSSYYSYSSSSIVAMAADVDTTATTTTTATETATETETTTETPTLSMLSSYDPATGDLLGQVPIASMETIQSSIQEAYHVQKTNWSQYSLDDRVTLLQQAYEESVQPFQEGISQLLSMEMGKDLGRARSEVRGAIRSGPYYAQEAAQALYPHSLGRGSTQYYIPLGVVVVISPWNYPVMMANNLIVPALVAGNTVLLKPSEETPLVANEFFGRLGQHLPKGVLTVLQGNGPTVGQPLVESPLTHMIAFTGSPATGRRIMERAAPRLKRLVMELGGNDPMIVLGDANVEHAARFAVAGGFENSGQMCTGIERVYVHESIATEFERLVTQYANKYRVGPWNTTNVHQLIGPIINEKQHAKIVQHIQDANQKGGRFLVGSSPDDLLVPPYIPPTVIADMTRDMLLEQDETFGPVIGIATFTTVEEVIERANDSELGLGAVVFGYNQAQEVADRLEAGMVGINQGQGGPGPWVGAKQSGVGYHGTPEGHRQFAQVKVVSGENK
jgi:succinate-semialdehyde dehydrogenase/glutarate-semialdehyde dehydrogenase